MKDKTKLLITWDPPFHFENVESIVLYRHKYGVSCDSSLRNGDLIFETENILEDSFVDEFDDFGTFRYSAFAKNENGYSPCTTNFYTIHASVLWFKYCHGDYIALDDLEYSYKPTYQAWEIDGENLKIREEPYETSSEYSKFFELDSNGNLLPTIYHDDPILDFEIEGRNQYSLDCNIDRVIDVNAINGTAVGDGTYHHREVVPISATADIGYEFEKWTTNAGEIEDKYNSSTNIEVTNSGYVTAIFNLRTINLTITGQNASFEGAGTYEVGSTVNIKAIPDAGYRFVEWVGSNIQDPLSAETTTLIDLSDTDRTITAVIAKETLIAGYSTSSAITSRSGDPIGTIYYATDTQKLYVYDGAEWIIYNS